MKNIKHYTTIIAMAIVTSLWSCQETKHEKVSEPITPDTQLTAEEIAKGVLSPEILWKFGRIGSAQLSPDGKQIVFTVTRYSMQANKGVTNIHIISTEGGEPKELTNNSTNDFSPQWINESKQIAFLSTRSGDTQLWKMEVDGTSPVQVTFVEGGINSFLFSPKDDKILYTKNVQVNKNPKDFHPDMPKANVRIIDSLMYRHWNYWRDGSFSHIFVAGYENGKIGEAKDIMEMEPWDAPMSSGFDETEITWSPCGKIIAYTCKKMQDREYATQTNSDIYIYNVEEGTTKNITEGMVGYDKYPVFSPDGKYLAWQSMETPGYESDKRRLFMMNMETSEKIYLTKDFDQNADAIAWGPCGKNILFVSGSKGTEQIYRINIESNEIKALTQGQHDYTWFGVANGVFVGQKMTLSMAPELFRIDLKSGEETQLTFINKHIYENIKMGETQQRWVKTVDGKDMLVQVVLPPNFDNAKKYPALLYCQGGPQSTISQFWSYRWNLQIMAANGYVVVAPNRRGVPSFGQEWNAQISGDYSGLNMKDYLIAVDEIAKETWVDKDRLGAVGASYGGYSVYYLAGTHQKRFKAFIAHNGIFNFESFYAATEETFFPNHDFGGAYWDKENKIAQRSYANSPHKLVKNWDTPIMVIVGENDFRIPYTEGLQAFNAAQHLGVPSHLLIFHDETHLVLKPQNAVIWQREFFSWLDKWLK